MNLPIDQQNIINILGIESLSDERKADLLEKMTDLVQKRLLLRLLENLNDQKQIEFQKLLDTGSDAEVAAFIKSNAPDFSSWIDEEIGKIKQDMADLVASATA